MKRMFANFNSQGKTVHDTINDFVCSKKGKKSDNTVKYYEERLKAFNDYLQEHEKIVDIKSVNRSVIDRYMNYKKTLNPKISNQTLNNNLRAIRTFVNYCIDEGHIAYFKVEMYPTTSIPRKPYTEDEQALLLKRPNMNDCTFTEYRNWVIYRRMA